MTAIRKWTGRESHALREAMRLSQRQFADKLGVTGRAVSKWEAGRVKTLSADSQGILDTVLRQVPPDVRARFELVISGEADTAEVKQGMPVSSRNAPGQNRSCGGCGLPLSRYNSGSLCQACTSAGRKERFAGGSRQGSGVLPQSFDFPAEFWDAPNIVEALRASDCGRLFALILDSAKVSQAALGNACGLDQGTVSSMIHGNRTPRTMPVLERIATGLGMPDHARVTFGLAPKRDHAAIIYAAAGEDHSEIATFGSDTIEAVKRRDFLAELAVSAGLGVTGLPLEAVRHGLNLSAAEERSTADADEWNEIALEYGESYLTAAPSELAKTLTVDMIGLQGALQRNSAARPHRELMRAASLLSVFTAQTMMNTGQVHESRRWWRTAKNSADRSGDPYSVLWVRAREINRADEYRPNSAILPLIKEAEGHADHAPVDAVLSFLGAKALTLTRAGRPRDAESVLDQIRKRSSGLPERSGSILAFDRAGGLHGIESFVYSQLGDLEKTESAYESARELRGSGNVRHNADDGLKLGFCLVRQGDITEGLGHAKAVLAEFPQQHRASYVISYAHELLKIVPASERQMNAVQEYRELLSSL